MNWMRSEQYLVFSQPWLYRLLCSDMWRHVVWYQQTGDDQCTGRMFCLFLKGGKTTLLSYFSTLKMEALESPKMLVTVYQKARCHIPDNSNPHEIWNFHSDEVSHCGVLIMAMCSLLGVLYPDTLVPDTAVPYHGCWHRAVGGSSSSAERCVQSANPWMVGLWILLWSVLEK
jgi:hypothetical protein